MHVRLQTNFNIHLYTWRAVSRQLALHPKRLQAKRVAGNHEAPTEYPRRRQTLCVPGRPAPAVASDLPVGRGEPDRPSDDLAFSTQASDTKSSWPTERPGIRQGREKLQLLQRDNPCAASRRVTGPTVFRRWARGHSCQLRSSQSPLPHRHKCQWSPVARAVPLILYLKGLGVPESPKIH